MSVWCLGLCRWRQDLCYLTDLLTDLGVALHVQPLFYWQDKAWADRWASNGTLVSLNELYVGWMMVRRFSCIALCPRTDGVD